MTVKELVNVTYVDYYQIEEKGKPVVTMEHPTPFFDRVVNYALISYTKVSTLIICLKPIEE